MDAKVKDWTDVFKHNVFGTLLKRWIKVEEIADGYVYLAKADAVTGEVLTIDAGWTMKS